MTDFIIALIFLALAVFVIMLRKAFFSLPLYELKRRAAGGDHYARQIYPIVAYEATFRGLLWLLLGLFTAISVVLLARLAPVWIGIILVGVVLWLTFSWLPNGRSNRVNRELALKTVPAFNWVLHHLYPLIKGLGRLGAYYEQHSHTGLYEPEDLHTVLLRQESQADNRISAVQLGRLRKLLAFEEAKVENYQTEWKPLLKLAADEPISPKLLDEMHQSGQTAFPVTKSKHSKVLVGILSREDVGLKSDGKVGDHMRPNVHYISQTESMESALAKFALSGAVLFVVVDKTEAIVGALTLKDALGSLLAPAGRNTTVVGNDEPVTADDSNTSPTEDEVYTGEINESTQ